MAISQEGSVGLQFSVLYTIFSSLHNRSILRDESSNPFKIAISWNILTLIEGIRTPSTADTFNNFCLFPATDSLASQKANMVEDSADRYEDDWRVFFDAPEEQENKNAVPHRFNKSIRESVRSPASHKAVFSTCWLSLLSELPKSAALSTRALSLLHTVAIPCVNEPLKFMDWVASCVDLGRC